MLKPTSILSSRQLLFLDTFNASSFTNTFYLSGGTALCGFYIPYRLSEDLDFFSEAEFDVLMVISWLKTVKPILGFSSFDLKTSFNRNIIFLDFQEETLKTEFTYYPFPTKTQSFHKIKIDSIHNIAINKLFTIYQNPRLRDYMDLYMILQKKKYRFHQLRLDAKVKFDWDIDILQLGSRLLQVQEQKDKPTLVTTFDYESMTAFFINEAKSFKKDVLSE